MPQIRRMASADFSRPAPQPANSWLDCVPLFRTAGIALPDWRIDLADCLADMADSTP